MRITTWNVNGLRAVMGKGFLDAVEQIDPDVLCLQEVRARLEQLEPQALGRLAERLPHASWNPAARPGYSGVATLTRRSPLKIHLGLADGAPVPNPALAAARRNYDLPGFDAEGRVIGSRYPGFVLFNIYFPNGGRVHERVPFKLDFYACLLDLCDDLLAGGDEVILCGDFNTSHQPIDLANPKSNEKNTGFLPEERAWIDRYLDGGRFVDVYRRLYPERRQYTWWTFISNARARNVGWRLDYFLVSGRLVERVTDVVIHDDIFGSDHCPVSLDLEPLETS